MAQLLIGPYPALSLADARSEWRNHRATRYKHGDPRDEVRRRQEAANTYHLDAWKFFRYAGKFLRYIMLDRRASYALKRAVHVTRRVWGETLRAVLRLIGMFSSVFNRRLDTPLPMDTDYCAVCRPDGPRCVCGELCSRI